jgi:hexosaminidase
VVGYAREPWEEFSQEPPAGQLRFMDDGAKSLVVSLLERLGNLLQSPYLGTGGDEINEKIYVGQSGCHSERELKS